MSVGFLKRSTVGVKNDLKPKLTLHCSNISLLSEQPPMLIFSAYEIQMTFHRDKGAVVRGL